ncbi:MAG: MFS transporter [Hyphomonadaceae bacterium]|nr:MFS transporter [Hyphomonadaceae bacterium]
MTDAPEIKPHQAQSRHYVLGLLLLVYMLNFIDRQIISILVEPIKGEFGLSDTQMGLLSGFAFAIFYATLGIPLAAYADRGNRRNLLVGAVGLFSMMTMLGGLAVNFWQLLLARIGVAVGEAGTSPASHSIIADLYPPDKLSSAMATFAVGLNIGLALGYLVGGWIGDLYGWRYAMLAVGLPGILVSLLLALTMREPARRRPLAAVEPSAPARDADTLIDLLRFAGGQKSLLFMLAGICMISFVTYGLMSWLPSYMIREHDLSLGFVGTLFAVMVGLLGGLGTFFGGRVSDMLARRDTRWTFWLLTLSYIVIFPPSLAMLHVGSTELAIALWCGPAVLSAIYMGGTLSMTQRLVRPSMRAKMSALMLFSVAIFGMGLGPTVTGMLSDAFGGEGNGASLRSALSLVLLAFPAGALMFWLGARTLKEDLERAASV